MDDADIRRRMRNLRRQVLSHDVDRWARSFLDTLGLPPPDAS
jgi:trehalose 6-phosphate synthase